MKYLYKFFGPTYNNELPAYEIKPPPGSDVMRAVVFAGGEAGDAPIGPLFFLIIETEEPINDANRYLNFELFEQLLWFSMGFPAQHFQVPISQDESIGSIVVQFGITYKYDRKVRHSGIVDDAVCERLVLYSSLLHRLESADLVKFQNALQTYVWAKQVSHLHNPQLNYTLFMTLYLACIDQLADKPRPKCSTPLKCPDCHETLNLKHSTSHGDEIGKLIKRLMTGDVNGAIKLVRRLYSSLRSDFMHEGLLGGREREGGFLGGIKSEFKLVEEMANVEHICRRLLELFLWDAARNT